MQKREILKRVILVIFLLYIFLLSVKLMGGSFKLFGDGLAQSLFSLTTNPFVALFIGILATTLVQSSSATTSIIVGLVASGSLGLAPAIPMIMGANIGTSITNTIVSLGHLRKKEEFRAAFEVATIHDFFNIMVVIILLPLELLFGILGKSAIYLTDLFTGSSVGVEFTSPLNLIVKPVSGYIIALFGSNAIFTLMLALVMLFVSLHFFVKLVKPLAETEFKHLLDKHIFAMPLKAFTFGVLLTIMVQSSSVTTSLAVPLAGAGIITLRKMFPYILGANIGTTITALLAALVTGSPAALTIALVHLLFNVFGLILAIPLREVPIYFAKKSAEFAMKSKSLPIVYIVGIFYLFPAFIIFVVG